MSTLTQRILRARAQRDAAEGKELARAQAPANRRLGQLARRDREIDEVLDGTREPRTAREHEVFNRAFYGDFE
jgi:hypothetical protein